MADAHERTSNRDMGCNREVVLRFYKLRAEHHCHASQRCCTAGSFAFGDADYARNEQSDGSLGEWEQSLWVLTHVMSVSDARQMVVVDAGG